MTETNHWQYFSCLTKVSYHKILKSLSTNNTHGEQWSCQMWLNHSDPTTTPRTQRTSTFNTSTFFQHFPGKLWPKDTSYTHQTFDSAIAPRRVCCLYWGCLMNKWKQFSTQMSIETPAKLLNIHCLPILQTKAISKHNITCHKLSF